jgi:hypothetical protein
VKAAVVTAIVAVALPGCGGADDQSTSTARRQSDAVVYGQMGPNVTAVDAQRQAFLDAGNRGNVPQMRRALDRSRGLLAEVERESRQLSSSRVHTRVTRYVSAYQTLDADLDKYVTCLERSGHADFAGCEKVYGSAIVADAKGVEAVTEALLKEIGVKFPATP